jgi:hypothetical protein
MMDDTLLAIRSKDADEFLVALAPRQLPAPSAAPRRLLRPRIRAALMCRQVKVSVGRQAGRQAGRAPLHTV